MTDFSTNLRSLVERREHKFTDKAWSELAHAVAALKDSERHILQSYMALKEVKDHPEALEALDKWSGMCKEATESCEEFLAVLGGILDYSDPFSSSS
jgi:hypothetical protein